MRAASEGRGPHSRKRLDREGIDMITHRLGHTVRLGLRSLAAHRLRSALTILGIVLGVASVIRILAVGSAAAEALFPFSDPVGRSITIDDIDGPKSYVVVGVTEPKTLAAGSGSGVAADYNRVAFIPFATDRLRFGVELISFKTGSYQIERLEISQITVTVSEVEMVPRTAAVIQGLLDQFHPRKDVSVFVPLDLLEKAERTQRLFTLVL